MGKKVSLVLGGGGARGIFHMGLLKAIQELGFEVEEISGTSIGAIVGVMYADNPNIDFAKVINNVNYFRIAKISYSNSGIISSDSIEKYLKEIIKSKKFSDLKIKLSFTTVDINKGEEVIFNKGDIFPGLIASMSIPTIFPIKKVKNKYLCDGGVLNNLPLDLIKKRKKVIVSDITMHKSKINEKSSRLDVIRNVYIIIRDKFLDYKKKGFKKNVIYIKFDKDYNMFDFRKSNLIKLYNLGYKKSIKILQNI